MRQLRHTLAAKLWQPRTRHVVGAAEQSLEVVVPRRAVERLMGDLGLSKKELADALDATPRTFERWRARGTYPQRDTKRWLAAPSRSRKAR